ncbi:DUF1294 domain-containing protein [Pseudomonas eucalypticola]|uniref:DUF1294 domain-containing protein n=1 Tax=Pseudomonas eucalypticola TaxID=2599595 RepID=A0A7D5D8B6_9PSED|nr:DUF1294 domain-containing protein [Pseudomonas eucalypticola]QKZ05440.1 DUF1294 domain-containing protein [Pseudomonas eucalypticola]
MSSRSAGAARASAGQRGPGVRYLKLKLAVWVLLCALPMAGVVLQFMRGGRPVVLLVYVLLSLIAAGLYWRDKHQARTEGRRTPEKVLHLVELLGGWPGALVAQQLFRHKTRKVSYQVVFWLIVLVHQAAWAYLFSRHAL